MGGQKSRPLPKICHTYPTMMKLGTLIPFLKRIQKYIKHVTDPVSSAYVSIFLPEISKFCCIKKFRYRLYYDTLFLIILTFFESWKIFLISVATILMRSAKMATLGLLKIKIFWNKGYDVIILSMTSSTKIYHVTHIILLMWLCDQSLVTLALLWKKLS